jgi:hypothetical protein
MDTNPVHPHPRTQHTTITTNASPPPLPPAQAPQHQQHPPLPHCPLFPIHVPAFAMDLDAVQEHYLSAYSASELRTFHCEKVMKMPLGGLDPSMWVFVSGLGGFGRILGGGLLRWFFSFFPLFFFEFFGVDADM